MAKFKIELFLKASKFYRSCHSDMARRLEACFVALEKYPFYGPNIKRMKTKPSEWVYRYRIGDYGVLYEVYEKEIIVLIVKIGTRGKVYKDL